MHVVRTRAVTVNISQSWRFAPINRAWDTSIITLGPWKATDNNLLSQIPKPIPVAMHSVMGLRLLACITGSTPTGCMDVFLLWLFCVFRWMSLRRADHPSRGVLPSGVCLSMISRPQQLGRLGPLGLSSHKKLSRNNNNKFCFQSPINKI